MSGPLAPPAADSRLRRTAGRLLDHARLPLHRDGYALAANSAFTAAAGLLYWIVAAQAYSAHAVGVNSALISSMMFLAGIAGLNLPNVLVRFLPEAGSRTARLAALSYAAASCAAVVAALVFIVEVGEWAPSLRFLHSDAGLGGWFVLSTFAWSLFAIQDSVLTALGRAVWVPVENAVFSLLKLGLLAAFAALLPVYGIFISWTAAMLVSVAGVNLVIFGRLMRRATAHEPTEGSGLGRPALARYFAADYVCSVAWLSATNLMPLVVTAVAGAAVNAVYALAWAVALPLYAFAANIGMSLVLHGTRERAVLTVLERKAALQGARVLVPSVLALAVLAPQLLSLFGGSYAEDGATLLRLLAAGALPYFVLVLRLSVARVQRRLRPAMVALGLQAALALGTAPALIDALGVTGAGVAWVSSQGAVAAGILALRVRPRSLNRGT
jgi:O-antigen/teichoic acid export membrane protein